MPTIQLPPFLHLINIQLAGESERLARLFIRDSCPRVAALGFWRPAMQQSKLRRQIAWEAARLMYSREEAEYYRAKQKAAHRICQGWVKPADLPSNAERSEERRVGREHRAE